MNRLVFFKYLIYGLLAVNIGFFLQADLASSAGLLSGGFGWTDLIAVFAETVDTVAWVALVLLFELETAVIPPERLRGGLPWLFSGVRALCYVAIVSSLLGYVAMWQLVRQPEPLAVQDACTLTDDDYYAFAGFDDYPPLTADNCGALNGAPLAQLHNTRIVGTLAELQAARHLALVDVINAATWLLVVALLEAEVYLQLRRRNRARLQRLARVTLAPLSAVLIGCAGYWLVYSDFLDFWDALLWLIAFGFIELNILDWQPDGMGSD